jgi:hypothetical protein
MNGIGFAMQFLPFCFRFWILRKTYPWMHIAILGWRVIASGNPRSQQMAEVWFRVYKIDFSQLLAIAIELSQPEFWI